MATKLDLIHRQIVNHPSNKEFSELGYQPIYRIDLESKIVLISQAPGRVSQEKNIDWQDASGETLRRWLGVTDQEFYDTKNFAVLPMDFYYPGKGRFGDLPPRNDFAPLWHPLILEQMKNVELIVLIGSYSQKYYLPKNNNSLTQNVANFNQFLPKYFPIVHPSPLNYVWKKANPWFESEVVPELQKIVREILD